MFGLFKKKEQQIIPYPEYDGECNLPIAGFLNSPPLTKKVNPDKSELLNMVFENYKVKAYVSGVTIGTSVTRYLVVPYKGVKLTKIKNLAPEISLALQAKSVRIEIPIPGMEAVGVEVENDYINPVYFRELIESREFAESKSTTTFAVGKDINGRAVVSDLKKMPHMLIAGATGSGKSVFINTVILSILYKATPKQVQFMMIDPKIVELGVYNNLLAMPFLVTNTPKGAKRALSVAVEEMERRYRLMAKFGVRNIDDYNVKSGERGIPKLVIIIDELADLMMESPKEVETYICRIAQKARAAGIHLLVATQRPSTNVVTGLIKANIPSRVAFAVASHFDSRTILDTAGAEKLSGKGDMLFLPQGASNPTRIQGAWVSDDEIEIIANYCSPNWEDYKKEKGW